MNIEEWRAQPQLAEELKKTLQSPILLAAFDVLKSLTMANAMNSTSLLNVAHNGQTLFGYDVGRSSIFKDLFDLAEPVKEIEELKEEYLPEAVNIDREKALQEIVRKPKAK
jgi:hypothetical protein